MSSAPSQGDACSMSRTTADTSCIGQPNCRGLTRQAGGVSMTQSSQRITNEGLTISMRTMGTTVAGVCRARRPVARGRWRSAMGAEVAVLRCCTALPTATALGRRRSRAHPAGSTTSSRPSKSRPLQGRTSARAPSAHPGLDRFARAMRVSPDQDRSWQFRKHSGHPRSRTARDIGMPGRSLLAPHASATGGRQRLP